MAVNNRLVSTIFDKIAPYINKGVKSAEHPNRIYFKPSDVPAEELGETVCEMKVADDAVVAPFADRLIHPNTFGLTPAVNTTKQLVESTRNIIDKCEDSQIKEKFSKLYSLVLDSSKDLPKSSYRVTSLMRSVEMIDNPKIKSVILDRIEFLNGYEPKKFKIYYENTMSFAENYADAANSISGKYLNIDNRARKFYKWMDKKNIWLLDIIDGTKKSEDTYRKGLLSSNTRSKKYPEYLRNYDEFTKKGLRDTYENNLRQDAMKSVFSKYAETRQEAVDILYKEEYLKTLPPDIAKECEEIQKEYNTYVITSNADTSLEDLKYLREELRLWKEAGKDEVIIPKMVHINAIDEYMLKTHSSGYANSIDKTVNVRELLQDDGHYLSEGSTLRHEIQHLQDEDIIAPKNSFDEWGDAISWKYNKIRYRKKWDKELENCGIKYEGHRDYAFKDRNELRSVTAEADMEKLSEDYKNAMKKKFKMQSWIFTIGPNKIAKESRIAGEIEHSASTQK